MKSNVNIDHLDLLIKIGIQALRGIKAETDHHLDLQRIIRYFELITEEITSE